jgi:polar amino acid transport system substrate-binding protein
MQVLVLGAEIVGTATAYCLLKDGHEVEAVERRPGSRPAGATAPSCTRDPSSRARRRANALANLELVLESLRRLRAPRVPCLRRASQASRWAGLRPGAHGCQGGDRGLQRVNHGRLGTAMTGRERMSETNEGAGVGRRNLLGAVVGTAGVIGTALAAAPRAAQAQLVDAAKSKLQQVLQRGHLIVGTGSTNPPWHFEDANGELIGMDIDLAHLLAKGLFDDPSKVEFVKQSADARIPSLITDKVDIVIQFMTVTPGRAQQVEFTIPYYREGVGLLLPADSPHKTLDDLKKGGSDIQVSALQNVFMEDWVHRALPEAGVELFDSPDASLQALNAGRADTYCTDQSTISWLRAQFPDRYRDAGYGWMPNSYAAAVRPGDSVWLNFVNQVWKEAMMGVDFDAMAASYKKWFFVDLPTPKVGFPTEFS